MDKYQIALYTTDGEVPDADEIVWESGSDAEAVAYAQTVMAGWPGWVGSLNRWGSSGRPGKGVWVADLHDGGQRVDTAYDGFDVAVNGVTAARV